MNVFNAAKSESRITLLVALILGIIIGYFSGVYLGAGAVGQAVASGSNVVGTVPVYRMWNLAVGDHFYRNLQGLKPRTLVRKFLSRNFAY